MVSALDFRSSAGNLGVVTGQAKVTPYERMALPH